jgi:histidinol-phosphatase (PHP family)
MNFNGAWPISYNLRPMSQRLVYEQHMHTPLCRHAEGEPEHYAAIADQRNLKGIVVTCHNPMPESYGHTGRMTENQLDEYFAICDRARRSFEGVVEVRVGLECDYFPGYLPYLEKQIASRPYEHVLGSVHPFLSIWIERFGRQGSVQTQRTYLQQLADAAETKLFDTLSHPDIVKNQTRRDWDVEALLPEIESCLDRVAATGVAMELNTSGLLKSIPEMNPGPLFLREMARRKIPVVVGADAHVPQRVAADFEMAYDLLQAAGYTHVSYFIERRRHELAIEAARASLRPAVSP